MIKTLQLSCLCLFWSCMAVPMPLPADYVKALHAARERIFNEDFDGARAAAFEASRLAPDDPESYELFSTVIIADLRRKLGVSQVGRVQDANRLAGLTVEIELCDQQIVSGIGKALQYLAKPGQQNNERVRFLLARLHANRLWLTLQILGERKGYGDYRNARNIAEAILKQDASNARAMVLLGWINYSIGSQGFFTRTLLRLGGVTGEVPVALTYFRQAISSAADRWEKAEAQFSLLSALLSEKQWPEAHELAIGLSRDFPANRRLRQQAQTACKSSRCPLRPHVR